MYWNTNLSGIHTYVENKKLGTHHLSSQAD